MWSNDGTTLELVPEGQQGGGLVSINCGCTVGAGAMLPCKLLPEYIQSLGGRQVEPPE